MLEERISDEELVRRFQQGGKVQREEVYSLLYARYARALVQFFGRSMRLDRETSRDLVQDTFLQVFRALDGFRGAASLRTWLFEIGRHAAFKKMRRDSAAKRSADEVSLDQPATVDGLETEPGPRLDVEDKAIDNPLDRLVVEDDGRQVRSVLDDLAPEERQMVFLLIWQELTFRETASVLGKPEGTVKSGWFRLKKSLGEKLGSMDSDLPL